MGWKMSLSWWLPLRRGRGSTPCTAGACQQQNQSEALVPYVRSALAGVVLRKNILQKRRYFHLGPTLVNSAPELCVSPQLWGRQEGSDALAWLGESKCCKPGLVLEAVVWGAVSGGSATSGLLVHDVQGPVWMI